MKREPSSLAQIWSTLKDRIIKRRTAVRIEFKERFETWYKIGWKRSYSFERRHIVRWKKKKLLEKWEEEYESYAIGSIDLKCHLIFSSGFVGETRQNYKPPFGHI